MLLSLLYTYMYTAPTSSFFILENSCTKKRLRLRLRRERQHFLQAVMPCWSMVPVQTASPMKMKPTRKENLVEEKENIEQDREGCV